MTIKTGHTFTFTSWNKPLAYLVGVYLSDGSVHEPSGRMKIFTHSSIDKEFMDKTASALQVILPTTTIRQRVIVRTKVAASSLAKRFTSAIHEVTVSNTEFCDWLQNITNFKTTVPILPKELMIHLLSAFIDGDGYISIFKDRRRIQTQHAHLRCYMAGICGKGPKMPLIVKAFISIGVKLGCKTIGKRDVETYSVQLSTLAESGVCFAITRKFFRFCEYVNQVKPSTTIRRTLIYTSDDIV